jgi:hypothetical protein
LVARSLRGVELGHDCRRTSAASGVKRLLSSRYGCLL